MDTKSYFTIPVICPSCKCELSIDGDFLYCRQSKCPEKLSGDVKVWIDRLGLLFWGESMIKSLTDPGNPNSVNSVPDLYKMSVTDLSEHCSGLKMATKCWDVLHKNKSIPLETVLSGMNISNLGISTATDIVKSGFDDINKIINMDISQLMSVPNIGSTTANCIKSGIDKKKVILCELDSLLSIKSIESGPLSGKKICITGDVWAPRKLVQKMIAESGGRAVDSVSKDTSALVCTDFSSSSKTKKAISYGIPIVKSFKLKQILNNEISWEEFIV